MKRHESLVPLSRDHRSGLILAQLIKKDGKSYKGKPTTVSGKVEYATRFYREQLVPHFTLEEEVLFPAVRGTDETVDRHIADLLGEHREIKTLVASLKNKTDREGKLDTLGRLLEAHIRKEEQNLFERIQEVMSEDKLQELKDAIVSHAAAISQTKILP